MAHGLAAYKSAASSAASAPHTRRASHQHAATASVFNAPVNSTALYGCGHTQSGSAYSHTLNGKFGKPTEVPMPRSGRPAPVAASSASAYSRASSALNSVAAGQPMRSVPASSNSAPASSSSVRRGGVCVWGRVLLKKGVL